MYAQLGRWISDANGLPCFQYEGELPASAKMPNGEYARIPDDPWFILGNYRLTVFPHVSGLYELISGQRSWARMNQGDEPNSGSNFTKIEIIGNDGKITDTLNLVGKASLAALPEVCKRTFGCGYAQYDYTTPKLLISRELSTLPSTQYDNGESAMSISLKIKNISEHKISIVCHEAIRANYRQMQYQRSNPPFQFMSEIVVSQEQSFIESKFKAQIADPLLVVPKNSISVYDIYPPRLYLYDANNSILYANSDSFLCAKKEITIDVGKTAELNYIIGYAFDDTDIISATNTLLNIPINTQWKDRLPNFDSEADSILRNEMLWNAYVLETMATYSNVYGETKIPQGTIYDYDWGQHASARDNFQHALPLVYYNPDLAKSVMRYMAQRTTPYGDIRLIEYGNGFAETLPYCTSDQQLFYFLLLSEYLRVTNDLDFLNEYVELYPKGSGAQSSILEITQNCFKYLKDVVGRGPHSLVRLLNSDWNDNVYVLNKVVYNEVIYTAESHLNTAMAIAILQNLIKSLIEYSQSVPSLPDKEMSSILAQSMEKYREELLNAFMIDLGDRSFSRRMYFGGEAVGEDNMYIEPQGYMLQIEELTMDQKQNLYNEICTRIYENEKIGARQQQSPDKEGPGLEIGSRENGGMWYAMNGPIIIGLSSFDKAKAWDRLRQLTFNNFAKQFPDYWTSYWSASDNIESSLMYSEGLCDQSLEYYTIPVFCAHPHAWLLYCYYYLT